MNYNFDFIRVRPKSFTDVSTSKSTFTFLLISGLSITNLQQFYLLFHSLFFRR